MRSAKENPMTRIVAGAARRIENRVGARGQSDTRTALPVLGALGVGAALMYFLDPNRGNRRRKLLSNKVVHTGHALGDAAGKTARDLRNRVSGVMSMARHRRLRETVDDRVLVERTRAELGRIVSHPGAIQVTAQDGTVALAGPVLRHEAGRLLRRVRRVRGVNDVEDLLELHDSSEGVPALQGGTARTGSEFELRQENWTPAARALTTVTGGALALLGAQRRGAAGAAAGIAGLALAARGATNKPLKRVTGTGGGRRAVDVQKTVNIDAPIDQVFAFCTDYENWPRFMTNVQQIRETRPGLQHWTVEGPAGTELEWDSEITRLIPDELVSWKTVDGAAVKHAGVMRFDRNDDGSTRVQVRMSYNPPAGAAGHAVAKLFGADPRRQMDEDLNRLKTTIETGAAPHDAAASQVM
ncbi:hypothetical protein BH23GEM2_BH23GEM2_05320 [soil metagenome]